MTETIIQPTTDADILNIIAPYEDSDDPNRKTHVVIGQASPPINTHIWKPGMSGQDIVDIARAMIIEVTALCGYTWVPKHNPEKFDACETCIRMAGQMMGD